MSWKVWSDQLLEDDKKNKACTGGLVGDLSGNVWGASGTLSHVTKYSEMAALCKNIFEAKAITQMSVFFPDKDTPGSEKYMIVRFVQSEQGQDFIVAKKGQMGLIVLKCKDQAFIMGHHDETVQPGTACTHTCKVHESLMKVF